MSMPDPRHSAASVPLTTPPAPQWGGEAPSVIDPGLIAKLGNAFLNASPGQTIDPQALANFAITQERPPAPPTSVPGAIGAAAAAPGTSVPGALATAPFAAGLPGHETQFGGAPPTVINNKGRHIPAAGLATGATGIPAGAVGTPLLAAGLPGPSPEKGQETLQGFPGEAELRALPQSLGQATSLVPTTHPSGFSPAGFSHSSIPAQGPEALYFLGETGTAVAPAQASVPAAAPPAPSFEQSPAFAPNYPSEADLRPQAPGGISAFPLIPSSTGFSHGSEPATPAIPGETLYFLNEGQAASAPVTVPEAPVPSPGSTAVTPTLEPALAPDLISGTRAFDAYAIKRDFPILHQQVHGKPLI
jgi:cysteine desulfurase/selenocysteine lyase